MELGRLIDAVRNPAQLVLGAFTLLVALGTGLLMLPFAVDDQHPGFLDALFMSTSATTITGMGTVDLGTFSLFGELVLLLLVQVGGFGIMTIGSALALFASRRIGLRQRMLARTEIGAVAIGELRDLIRAIAKITISVEVIVALVLFPRFWMVHDISPGRAAYSAVFHAISGFNGSGFTLHGDLTEFVGDPIVNLSITAAFIIGGLGFPVLLEFRRRVLPSRWSLHTRLTLAASAVLLVVGPLVVMVFEWTNPGTLGPLDAGEKLWASWFQGTTPRTAGFNTVPIGEMHEPTLVFIAMLMFIGAGPASTSGGIKVTTFALLAFVIWSEVRGDRDVNVFRRRVPPTVIRQAVVVALLSVAVVVGTAMILVTVTDATLTPAVFEAASAFGTAGLTTGLTPMLPWLGQILLIVVMLAGRVGPITFVTALALRDRSTAYRYPEERPIIG